MDVRIEETIDKPYALVLQALLAEPGQWLPGLARDAADQVVTDLAVQVGNVRLARSVKVDVTPPTIYPDRREICVAWKAASGGLSTSLRPASGWTAWQSEYSQRAVPNTTRWVR